jgi:hypothetical protein
MRVFQRCARREVGRFPRPGAAGQVCGLGRHGNKPVQPIDVRGSSYPGRGGHLDQDAAYCCLYFVPFLGRVGRGPHDLEFGKSGNQYLHLALQEAPEPLPFTHGNAWRGLADEIGQLLHHRRQMRVDSRYEIPDHPFVDERLRLKFVRLVRILRKRHGSIVGAVLAPMLRHYPLFRVVPTQGAPFSMGNLPSIGVRVVRLEPE